MPYGYFTQHGYMGKVGERMVLFASERDYLDYIDSSDAPSFCAKNPTV